MGAEQGNLGRSMEQRGRRRGRGEEGKREAVAVRRRIGRGSKQETMKNEKWCEKDRDREKDGEREKWRKRKDGKCEL